MKKFRFLLVLAMVVAMISTVAFAADFDFKFATDSVTYTEGSAVTVQVVATGSATVDTAALVLEYDADVWNQPAATDCTSDKATAKYVTTPGTVQILWEGTGIVLDGTQNIATVTFTAKAGVAKADVLASKFSIQSSEVWENDWSASYNTTAAEIAVVEAAQKTPAAVTGGTAEFKSFTGSTGTVYNNVWVNKYTAKANDETIKAVKLAFNGETVTVSDVEIAAGGTAEFDVAIVGAALNATVTPSVEVK